MIKRITVAISFASVVVAGCKDNESKAVDDTSKTKPAEGSAATTPATAKPATPDDSSRLAALPKKPVSLPELGLELDAPEGAAVEPEKDPEDAKRRAHVHVGELKLNVFAVDEFSAPSFDKAKEIYEKDQLVEWITSEKVGDGWVLFKHVNSSLHKGPRWEVNTRSTVRGKAWDCLVSAPSRGLAELALAACKTLR